MGAHVNISKDDGSRLLQTLDKHTDFVNCMAIAGDKSVISSAGDDGMVGIWETNDEQTANTEFIANLEYESEDQKDQKEHKDPKEPKDYVTCMIVQDEFVITGSSRAVIKKWEMTGSYNAVYNDEQKSKTGQKFKTAHNSKIRCLISTGNFFFSSSNDRTVKAWIFDDAREENLPIRTFEGHTKAVTSLIYITKDEDNLEDNLEDEDNLHLSKDNLHIYVPENDILITGSEDKTARSWNFYDGGLLNIFKGHRGAITCMDRDQKGEYLYTGSTDNDIRSWHIRTGKPYKIMEGHTSHIMSLIVVNHLLYSVSKDKTARCWFVSFGDCLQIFHGATDTLLSVKFQDGVVFTAGGDGTVRAYDNSNQTLIHTFKGHKAAIECMVFGNNKMFTGSTDTTIKVWDIKNLLDHAETDGCGCRIM